MNQINTYNKHNKHFLAVDCVIFGYEDNELKVLLYPRGFTPFKGKWSLLGGFVNQDETLGDATRRILHQTTGLENIFQEQVHAFSAINRDPAARVISVAYYALIRLDKQDHHRVLNPGAKWWPVCRLPELVFDHKEMLNKSLENLQQKARMEIVGRDLLGEMFTLTTLKNLYEAIFQKQFDTSNFRKKMLSLNMLEKTSLKDYSESKKGAYLYKYKLASSTEVKLDVALKF